MDKKNIFVCGNCDSTNVEVYGDGVLKCKDCGEYSDYIEEITQEKIKPKRKFDDEEGK